MLYFTEGVYFRVWAREQVDMSVIPEAPPASLDYPPASLTPESSSDCRGRIMSMYPLMGPDVRNEYFKKKSLLLRISKLAHLDFCLFSLITFCNDGSDGRNHIG